MCAKDRSQNSVCSQTELVNSLFHLADVSSCPCLIRDSSGIIVHSNLLLTSKILEDINISKVFSLFSHSDLRSLNEEDVRVITYGGGKIVDGVTIGKYNCSILIEGFLYVTGFIRSGLLLTLKLWILIFPISWFPLKILFSILYLLWLRRTLINGMCYIYTPSALLMVRSQILLVLVRKHREIIPWKYEGY